jgi:hypothetical protein
LRRFEVGSTADAPTPAAGERMMERYAESIIRKGLHEGFGR